MSYNWMGSHLIHVKHSWFNLFTCLPHLALFSVWFSNIYPKVLNHASSCSPSNSMGQGILNQAFGGSRLALPCLGRTWYPTKTGCPELRSPSKNQKIEDEMWQCSDKAGNHCALLHCPAWSLLLQRALPRDLSLLLQVISCINYKFYTSRAYR